MDEQQRLLIVGALHNEEYVLDARDTDLSGSQFHNVLLTETTFKDASFERPNFHLARFKSATMRYSSLEGSTLEAVDLTGSASPDANMPA